LTAEEKAALDKSAGSVRIGERAGDLRKSSGVEKFRNFKISKVQELKSSEGR